MKVFLFALLAVVGLQVSARVINEPGILKGISELIESAELELSDDLPRGISNGLREEVPAHCVRVIKPAYETAVEIRRILRKGRELLFKLRAEVMNCYAMEKPADMTKCLDDVKDVAVAEGKPLVKAYLKARSPVYDLLLKAEHCMRGETDDFRSVDACKQVTTFAAQQCLPYFKEGYDRAWEYRRISIDVLFLAYDVSKAYENCETLENSDAKMKCYHEVMKMALNKGKPIVDAYMELRPKIIQTMEKFDKCMAA